MKKRMGILIMTALIFLLAACGSREETSVKEAGADAPAPEASMDDAQAKKEGQTADGAGTGEAAGAEAPAAQTLKLSIYYSNEMADGLEVTTIEADRVTPELLLSSLAQYNIVTPDTKVRSAETRAEGEETVLFLDLSKEFGSHVSTMGTSGEYVIIGALTNTFLDAYDADRLRLTVEGERLETGHASYDWDLTRYPLTSYTVETEVYEEGDIRISYPRLVNMRDDYLEDEWNEVFETYAKKDLEFLDQDAQYRLEYETATATEELLSVVYRVESYEPEAAYPYRYIQTFNIDLNSGKEVRLKDFIDVKKVADCLADKTGYELVGEAPESRAFEEYLSTSPDVLTPEYFEEFDLDSANPDHYPLGYSYKKDGAVIVCMEVPHAVGDYAEIRIK